MELQISPAPYSRVSLSVQRIMSLTIVALLPATGAAIFFFGYHAISVIVTSVATALLTEYLVKKLRGRAFVMDGSAPLIGLLIALTLPPTIDLWMAAIGVIFAIAIVKEVFGGLGHYIFSPVMGAWVFLKTSFVAEMSTWIKPTGFAQDIIVAERPLSETFTWLGTRFALYKDMFSGNTAGSLGETSAMLILIGGILLLAYKLIDWRIPLAFIGTVAVLSLALGEDPIFQILAGGLMLAAFFIATDSVISPITHKGRIIFGIGCGVLTLIIRHFAAAQEGVYYSVLFMNAIVPLLDRFTRARPLGLRKAVKSTDA